MPVRIQDATFCPYQHHDGGIQFSVSGWDISIAAVAMYACVLTKRKSTSDAGSLLVSEGHRDMAKQAKDKLIEDPLPDVLAAIAGIQKGYDQGLAILKQYGEHAAQGEIDQAAKEYGRTSDAVRKLRQFATGYSKSDVRELCNLCREKMRAFGLTHIFRLVAIKDKAKRKSLQEEAITKHWASGQLFRVMQRRKITQGHSRGRKRSLPKTVADALLEIEEAKRLLVELLDHCAQLAEQANGKASESLRQTCKRLLKALNSVETPGRRQASSRSQKAGKVTRGRKPTRSKGQGLQEGESFL
jgi:hypothetical protein